MIELALGLLGGLLRFAGASLLEVVLELLIKGAGHLALSGVRARAASSELWCTVVGVALWLLLGVAVLAYFQQRGSV
jgi:hypothetical protein